MSNLLIIFAKAPDPGRVKTRLTPFLSKEQAAKLQHAFIQDLLKLTETAAKKNGAERVIACAPPDHPFFKALQKKEALRL
ncbi:MAG: glycosyltransferase, partial [Nitrospiria bacterium]